jgi:hypothetical protein
VLLLADGRAVAVDALVQPGPDDTTEQG